MAYASPNKGLHMDNEALLARASTYLRTGSPSLEDEEIAAALVLLDKARDTLQSLDGYGVVIRGLNQDIHSLRELQHYRKLNL